MDAMTRVGKGLQGRFTVLLCMVALLPGLGADPLQDSWFTDKSGAYARVFQSDADVPGSPVVSWIHPDGGTSQSTPTYAGLHEVSSTTSWLYIRSSGLGGHIMGPWYADATRTTFFPGFPNNRAAIYRFPRVPAFISPDVPKTITPDGAVGYFVNGVAMFDSRDDFSYSNGAMRDVPNGGERWNRDAYVNELLTFDAALAHQANGIYHYHSNPPALRYQLGDAVDYNPAANTYTENPVNLQHSPILAWCSDGLPLYGPYGYDDPLDANSGVRRMISGFRIRAGLSTRGAWPAWATRLYGAAGLSFRVGPDVDASYPLGRYMEDNEYKGDVGMTLGVEFDLNEFNTRFCVTPEFPAGTWAYFTCIQPDGTPVFPYNMARAYFGDPVGGRANGIPDSDEAGALVDTLFEGGPEKIDRVSTLSPDNPSGDDMTVVFSGVEGGTYEVERSSTLGSSSTWTPVAPAAVAGSDLLSVVDAGGLSGAALAGYYRVKRTGVAPFDDNGFDIGTGGGSGTLITVTLAGDGGQSAPANLSFLPSTLTFNGVSIDLGSASRPSQQEITFRVDLAGLAPGDYDVVADFPGVAGTQLGTHTIVEPNSILLLIVDDWGIDSSPIDNNTVLHPGTTFPNMPTVESLAAQGIRFTNGYAQPVCSPTRAALLTGRQAWRTGVGAPNDVLQAAETTLPEAFAAAASPYALASFGKWHLGGGNTGYSDLGGWPTFVGITGGGAQDYYSWPKNDNGTVANGTTTYTTTDQVNEAKTFIDSQELAGNPWFVWMGFNAPHTPFHEPPANLLQGATGTSNRALYEKALEALDTEISRLLQSVDLATTTIILVGDNGTPGQVVQAPYGPTGPTGHSKSDLYEGGIKVPFVIRGPGVPAGSTSDRLVHVADLFPTILELAGVPLPGTGVDATSLVPLLEGTDNTSRYVVTETFNDPTFPAGRSIRMEADPAFPGSDPDYKLIINGDPTITTDTPTFEFYHVAVDENEQSPLAIAALNATEQAAYDALIAKDAALGGTYSAPASGGGPTGDVVYLELPNPATPAPPMNLNLDPDLVTVNGTAVNVTYVSRSSYGADLSDEGDDVQDRYWVKCTVDPGNAPYTSAEVDFPDAPGGNPRIFTATNIFVIP